MLNQFVNIGCLIRCSYGAKVILEIRIFNYTFLIWIRTWNGLPEETRETNTLSFSTFLQNGTPRYFDPYILGYHIYELQGFFSCYFTILYRSLIRNMRVEKHLNYHRMCCLDDYKHISDLKMSKTNCNYLDLLGQYLIKFRLIIFLWFL